MQTNFALKALPLTVALAFSPVAYAELPTLSEQDVIKGSVDIQFNTRTQLDNSGKFEKGSPKLGVKDIYKINMNVAQTTEFAGTIERQPKVKVKLVGVEAQAGALTYDMSL